MKNTCDFREMRKDLQKMAQHFNAAMWLYHQIEEGSGIELNRIADELEQACAAARAAVCYSSTIHFDPKRNAYYCEKCCDAGDENITLVCSFRNSEEHEGILMNYDEMVSELTVLAFYARDRDIQLHYCTRQLIENPRRFEMH